MKKILVLVFVTLVAAWMNAADLPTHQRLELDVIAISQTGKVDVELSNGSKVPVRVWDDDNPWGAARFRILRIRKQRIDVFYQNPNRIFTMGGPSFTKIAAGGKLKFTLDVNTRDWCTASSCSEDNSHRIAWKAIDFIAGDQLIVIYDVPRTLESSKDQVWSGVLAEYRSLPQ